MNIPSAYIWIKIMDGRLVSKIKFLDGQRKKLATRLLIGKQSLQGVKQKPEFRLDV